MKKKTYVNSGAEAKAKAAKTTEALKGLLEGPGRKELFCCALRLCRNVVQADELVQEACFRALKAKAGYDPEQSLVGWVSFILRNVYFDSRRRLATRSRYEDSGVEAWADRSSPQVELVADGTPTVLDALVSAEESAAVVRALGRLPKNSREVVTLCDLSGLAYEDAAKRLDIPLGTLRSRLFRARAQMRREVTATVAVGGNHGR
jgi:RNA polymerase sigma-70 factor (ECF subfamily)